MHTRVLPHRIDRGPKRRHDARVRRFSVNEALLAELDGLAVDDVQARRIIEAVCADLGVEVPRIRFHARRSPFTDATEQHRRHLVHRFGEEKVQQIEESGAGPIAHIGAIRLGRVTTLMTVAHELGHHLVFCLDPCATPNHGKKWVQRFDEAAASISSML